MSLDDLNRELYKAQSDALEGRTHEQSEYDPSIAASKNPSPFDKQQQWNRVEKGMGETAKKRIKIALGILAATFFIFLGFFGYKWWQKNAFHQDRVSVSFEGPRESDSTQSAKYLIHFKNNNRVSLKNAEIQLKYAENFQPTDNLNLKFLSPTSSKIFIGDIKPMSEGTAELKGVFYAPKDFPVYLHAALHFTPSNANQELVMEGQIGVSITAAPVQLNISAPQQAVSGDKVHYVIDYKNLDSRQMNGVQIHVDFPDGFSLSSSQPNVSEGNSDWYVGNLDTNQSGKINIQGLIKGQENESKDIAVSLGHKGEDGKFITYSRQELSTHMVSPILQVAQMVEGKTDDIINAGEELKYVIKFVNTGSIGLRDAIINAKIDGRLLDFSKINVENGAFDGKTGIMTWKASDVPALAIINPKAGGQVRFSVPVKTVIPVSNKLDKNFVVTSIAKIDSPDIPTPIDSNKIIGSNQLELKLASKVLFDTKGYYKDANLKNTGPIPMQTGQETTFALHWSIINVSNDITEGKVTSSLPSGVRWVGQIFPTSEKISYNSRTNQLTWQVGDVSAGTGINGNSPREAVFQVAVTPQLNQVGQPIKLINKSIFTATDNFVNKEISIESDPRDTQLYEDPSVGSMNGKVAK